MKTTDLRRSNAVYILRAVFEDSKSVEEIAKETEMSEIAVKKILYDLYNRDILSKYKDTKTSIGRPKIYFGLNSMQHCTIIKREDTHFSIETVNVKGERTHQFDFPLDFHGLSESGSLRMVRAYIKSDKTFKYNLGIFLMGNDIEKLENLRLITKTTMHKLILDSLYDEDLVMYAEINQIKYLLNHGKIKEINISVDELKKIVDLDREIILNDENQDNYLAEALRLISLLKLEEKI